MLAEGDRLQKIRSALPEEGLFAKKDWLLSPDLFPIEPAFERELEQLGHRLFVFQRACNQLYLLSVKGKQPEWIARYLDAGKPPEYQCWNKDCFPEYHRMFGAASSRRTWPCKSRGQRLLN